MMRLKPCYNWSFNEEVQPLLSVDGHENLFNECTCALKQPTVMSNQEVIEAP